jgi:hypothetical protein
VFLLLFRNEVTYVGFEVLTAVVMKSTIFWDISPCGPLSVNRRFGGTYRLHLQGQNKYCHALGDRRRGIGLTIGFITIVHSSTIQLSLSGLPQSYNSRLNVSQQFQSQRNRCNPGNRRTPGSLPSFLSLVTNQPTHSLTNSKLSNSLDTQLSPTTPTHN